MSRRFRPKLKIHSVPFVSILDDADGGIACSSYWRMELAEAGRPFLSTRRFSFRLLLPPSLETALPRLLAARKVVVSRGPWPDGGREDALEFFFLDGRSEWFTIRFGMEQADRWPPDPEMGADRTLSLWTFDSTAGWCGMPKRIAIRQVVYRRAATLGPVGTILAASHTVSQP